MEFGGGLVAGLEAMAREPQGERVATQERGDFFPNPAGSVGVRARGAGGAKGVRRRGAEVVADEADDRAAAAEVFAQLAEDGRAHRPEVFLNLHPATRATQHARGFGAVAFQVARGGAEENAKAGAAHGLGLAGGGEWDALRPEAAGRSDARAGHKPERGSQ